MRRPTAGVMQSSRYDLSRSASALNWGAIMAPRGVRECLKPNNCRHRARCLWRSQTLGCGVLRPSEPDQSGQLWRVCLEGRNEVLTPLLPHAAPCASLPPPRHMSAIPLVIPICALATRVRIYCVRPATEPWDGGRAKVGAKRDAPDGARTTEAPPRSLSEGARSKRDT